MFGDNSAKDNNQGPPPVDPSQMQYMPHPAQLMPIPMPTPAMPMPPPNTMIAPTAPLMDNPPAQYPQSHPPQGPPTIGKSTAFLDAGPGAPNPQPLHVPAPAAAPHPTADGDDLVNIKQHALEDLAPLVDKLEQPPEERFKTLMMMIQASDNSEYLDEAYSAANGIKDEKDRAQALLDVVNEINYFTQQPDKSIGD